VATRLRFDLAYKKVYKLDKDKNLRDIEAKKLEV